jgi:hypothetical protein
MAVTIDYASWKCEVRVKNAIASAIGMPKAHD